MKTFTGNKTLSLRVGYGLFYDIFSIETMALHGRTIDGC
jgi:hypothetical protein